MEITRYHVSIDNGDEYVSRSQHGKYVRYDEAMAMVTAITSQLESVVAENAALNKFIKDDCWTWDDKSEEYFDAADCMPEAPATDAFLAEVRASAVEECAEHLLSNDDIGVDSEYLIIRQFAAQLRQVGAV